MLRMDSYPDLDPDEFLTRFHAKFEDLSKKKASSAPAQDLSGASYSWESGVPSIKPALPKQTSLTGSSGTLTPEAIAASKRAGQELALQKARQRPNFEKAADLTEYEKAQSEGSILKPEKEYEARLNTLRTDSDNLQRAIEASEARIKEKWGENWMQDYYARKEAIEDPNYKYDKNEVIKRQQEFEADQFINDRNKFITALEANQSSGVQILKDDKYAYARALEEYDKQRLKKSETQGWGNLTLGILQRAAGKLVGSVGEVMNIGENLVTQDKKYGTWDKIEDFFIDFQEQTGKVAPRPTKYTRPLYTKTAKTTLNGEKVEVDFQDDKPAVVRDSKGVVIDADPNQFKDLKPKNQYNSKGLIYQTGEVLADAIVQIATTKGIGGTLVKTGMGAKLAYATGVTASTMGQMAGGLYDQGLKMFDGDKRKAAQYATMTGLAIGVGSNLFGLEARLAGGPGVFDNLTMTQVVKGLTPKAAAARVATNFFKQGAGEAFEETILEKGIEGATAMVLNGDAEDIDLNEMKGTALISFAVGALMGAGESDFKNSAWLVAAENPDLFKAELEKQGVKNAEKMYQKALKIKGLSEIKEVSEEDIPKLDELTNLQEKAEKAKAIGAKEQAKVFEEQAAAKEVEIFKESEEEISDEVVAENSPAEIPQETPTQEVVNEEVATDENLPAETSIEAPTQAVNLEQNVLEETATLPGKAMTLDELKQKEAQARSAGDESAVDYTTTVEDEVDFKQQYAKKYFGKNVSELNEEEAAEIEKATADTYKGNGFYNEDLDDFIGDEEAALRSYWEPDQEPSNIWSEARMNENGYELTQTLPSLGVQPGIPTLKQQQDLEAQGVDLANTTFFTMEDGSIGVGVKKTRQPIKDQQSTTPVKDAWNVRVETIDTETSYTDTKNLEAGDAVITKQGTLGFVTKVNPRNVKIETTWGGHGDNDYELMELSVKKEDIAQFKKPKTVEAAQESRQEKQRSLLPIIDEVNNFAAQPGFITDKTWGVIMKSGAMNWLKKAWKYTFFGRGDLPLDVAQLNYRRIARIEGMMKQAELTANKLKKLIKGKSKQQVEDLNYALQSTATTYSDGRQIEPEILDLIAKMREHVKAMSSELINTGIADGKLAAIISQNLDTYLTRSYQIHFNKNWVKTVKDTAAYTRAKAFLDKKFAQEEADAQAKIAKYQAKLSSNPEYWGKRIKNQQKRIGRDVEAELDSILEKQAKGLSLGDVAKSGSLGSMNLGVFKKRKDIAEEIRDVFGEVKDPTVNYMTSIFKVAHILENNKFLSKVEDEGKDKFLFERPTGPYTSQFPDTPQMGPLAGYYSTPEIVEAFRLYNKPIGDMTDDSNPIEAVYKGMLSITSRAKSFMTIFSIASAARNFTSNLLLQTQKGLFNITNIANGKAFDPNIQKAFDLFKGDNESELVELYSLGVLGDGITFGEIADVRKQYSRNFAGIDNTPTGQLAEKGRMMTKFMSYIYQFGDEFYRAIDYYRNLDKMARLYMGQEYETLSPDAQQEVKQMAAERVSSENPTYSRLPRNIKALRRNPFLAPFPSFPYEMVRVSYNIMDNLVRDMKNGQDTKVNVGGVEMSYKNLMLGKVMAGTMAVSIAPFLLKELITNMLGWSDDDDEKLKYFVPFYHEGSLLIPSPWNEKKGSVDYYDWGYMFPQGHILSTLSTVSDERLSPAENIGRAAEKFFEPFYSPDPLMKSIVEAVSGRQLGKNGRSISQVGETDWLKARMGHVGKKLTPGTIKSFERVFRSFNEPETDYYGKLTPVQELVAIFPGFRSYNVDIHRSFGFIGRTMAEKINDSKADYGVEKNKEQVKALPPKERKEHLDKIKERELKDYEKFVLDFHKIYMAAVEFPGVDKKRINEALADVGLDAATREGVKTGKVKIPEYFKK